MLNRLSKDPGLEPAKAMLDRIARRQIYTHLGNGPADLLPHDATEEGIRGEIFAYNEGDDVTEIEESDLIVEFMNVHHGKKDKNPVDQVS